MKLSLFNTMSRQVEPFIPVKKDGVGMYCCGPTVYNYAHIGNLRTYIFEDVLRRTLEYASYNVDHVMNITDVGHLTGDGDDGEDKMLKSAQEKGLDVYQIAQLYTDAFFNDTHELNITLPTHAPKATEHIQQMIDLIKRLEQKGHTYTSGGNVYFSIDTFPHYGELARLKLDELQEGSRIEVDANKKNPKDFVLWFTQSKFENQAMTWPSPWGVGYPGWHIECSAMSMEYLGESFDLHCGGIDHISVHHTNEIAQSEAATGKPWVKYWVHGEFLLDESGKMSKSKGEFLTLSVLKEKGFDPLDYRFFCLGAHYRSQLVFTWDALKGAQNSRKRLVREVHALQKQGVEATQLSVEAQKHQQEFATHMGHDLNTPRALASMWGVFKDESLDASQKLALLYDMDRILGLKLDEQEQVQQIPQEILDLVDQRLKARKQKEYAKADEIRAMVEKAGYTLIDKADSTEVVASM